MNTSGGGLSEAYVHGFNLINEGVKQMRGTSTAQVEGAETCLVTSGEGVPTSALLLPDERLGHERMTKQRRSPGGYVANLGPSVEGFLLPAMDEEGGRSGQATGRRAPDPDVQFVRRSSRHPPRPMCPRCRSTHRGWQAGVGQRHGLVLRHSPPPVARALLRPRPLQRHRGGPRRGTPTIRFVGNLVTGPEGALNEIDPETIRIGEPVEVVFKRFSRADGSDEAMPMWVRSAP